MAELIHVSKVRIIKDKGPLRRARERSVALLRCDRARTCHDELVARRHAPRDRRPHGLGQVLVAGGRGEHHAPGPRERRGHHLDRKQGLAAQPSPDGRPNVGEDGLGGLAPAIAHRQHAERTGDQRGDEQQRKDSVHARILLALAMSARTGGIPAVRGSRPWGYAGSSKPIVLWGRKACTSTQRNRSVRSLAGPSGSSRTTPPWGSARAEPRQRS